MATNFDKAMTAAPTGLDALAQDGGEEPISIEIIDPEQVNIHADGLDLSITPTEPEFNSNLEIGRAHV